MWSSADIIGVLRYVRFVPEPETGASISDVEAAKVP
jgi:hypothetical protein